MTSQEIRELASRAIHEECALHDIEVKRIILFGSQAREQAGPDSDWDFLVCVNCDMPFAQRTAVSTSIQRRLATQAISADLIFKSEARLKQERGNVGVVSYYALRDGVPV
jgi:predicted nucleotidyltransferase